ncbi:HPr family phosphocarrier protein [Microbacterium esteraromaticum]|uniref:HPr family phosphocarrier protein n=1 Tax=Microbacterium esteraromaticum TaxID=57043 RepID=A0A939DX68_9MICO|nr:HPr family phosphocarrier protein [Microbacterium esteraromaticum]MBN8206965.1 HPr family phosphocarrier protein [Microbacterium esteraromaticum]MBN8417120.1 HPr family phosphocarrier protein [Microbacterium esteraromaticum]MBN8425749.1 HPr family phosphocarrier protein [Microbacterium esteraromaticum]
MSPLRRRVTVAVEHGVHARPVAELVRLAEQHGAPVMLSTDSGQRVDLSSVLAVMDLAIAAGDEVVLEVAPSPGADALLDALSEVLAATRR